MLSNKDDMEAGCTVTAAKASSPEPTPWWDEAIWLGQEELSNEERQKLRTTVAVLVWVCVAMGLCAAATVGRRSATENALFSEGVEVFFFLELFSSYMRLMLRPCLLEDMPRAMLACLVGLTVLLHAAGVAFLQLMGRDQVAFAGCAVWLVDVAAAVALVWCFWKDRQVPGDQFCNDARPRRTFVEIVRGRVAGRRSAIRFAMAVSAACAVGGGATVAYLPGVSAGAAFGLGFAGLLFLLPFTMLHVPMLRLPVDASRPFACCVVTTVIVLAALYLAVLLLAGTDKMLAVTGFLWASDFAAAASLGWLVSTKKDTPRYHITPEEGLEVVRTG